jgi:hypothetical protein
MFLLPGFLFGFLYRDSIMILAFIIKKQQNRIELNYFYFLPTIMLMWVCLTLMKMGFFKNDLENFNCLFLKKVWSDDFFQKSLCQLQAF